MRKYYLDNLRWMAVVLMIPFHTAMMYNNWGESFYIWVRPLAIPSMFVNATYAWFIPLLFALAGVSTRYALEKRSAGAYLKERLRRLLVPLVAGILLLNPIQTYFAERYHNGYTGGYFAQYILFFTKETDLTGYHGGFTPSSLWFILYLLIISLAALPLILLYRKANWNLNVSRWPVGALVLLFVVPTLCSVVGSIANKSLGEFFSLFMLGYLFLADDALQQKLARWRWIVAIAWLSLTGLILFQPVVGAVPWPVGDFVYRLTGWLGILALLGLGRQYLNFNNRVTEYLSKASFPTFVLHQTVVVSVAYFAVGWISSATAQFVVIVAVSVTITYGLYALLRRWQVTRFLLGIK